MNVKSLCLTGVKSLGVVVLYGALSYVFADYNYSGGESQVQSFFDGTSGFLIKTVGTGIFLLGLIGAGYKIATGDEQGLRQAGFVAGGGALIFLAKPIVGVIMQMTGIH